MLLNAKSNLLDPDITKRLTQQPVTSTLGTEPTPTEEDVATAMEAMSNAKTVSGIRRPFRETVETRTSTWSDHFNGALPTNRLHLVQRKRPTTVKRGGYDYNPQEG